MRRLLWLGLALAACGASSGCQEQGTEIVFEIWSDYTSTEVTSVELRITGVGENENPRLGEGCQPRRVTVNLGAEGQVAGFPFTYAVRAGEHCNDRVYVDVTFYNGTWPVARTGGWERFEPGTSRSHQISVAKAAGCSTEQLWCDDQCYDGNLDANNCGWCGNRCGPGTECQNGWCDCGSGKVTCGEACVDLATDPAHCGDCATACPSGQLCQGGTCTSTCGSGLTECSGSCVDTNWDPNRCGRCDTACPENVACVGGGCDPACMRLLGGSCDPIGQCGCPGGQRCDGVPDVYASSPEVCVRAGDVPEDGMCGAASGVCQAGLGCFDMGYGPVYGASKAEPTVINGVCMRWCRLGDRTCDAAGKICAAIAGQSAYGVCVWPGSVETCNGIDDNYNFIVDDIPPDSGDPANCGRCGNACSTGQMCWNGNCIASCEDAGLSTCYGYCMDTTADDWNCGTCEHACNSDGPGLFCLESTCHECADAGLTNCSDWCTDARWDLGNCGWCGNYCGGANQTCNNGVCDLGGVGAPCYESNQCGDGGMDRTWYCPRDIAGLAVTGGYCTKGCSPGRPADCPVGTRCIAPTSLPVGLCLATCTVDHDCRWREGYYCYYPPEAAEGLCAPLGFSDSILSGGTRGT